MPREIVLRAGIAMPREIALRVGIAMSREIVGLGGMK